LDVQNELFEESLKGKKMSKIKRAAMREKQLAK
jgi:hypothetical protein